MKDFDTLAPKGHFWPTNPIAEFAKKDAILIRSIIDDHIMEMIAKENDLLRNNTDKGKGKG